MMDKFAMIAGRRNFFEVEIEGNDLFNKLLDGDKGLIIASSHVGNFELSGYLLQQDKKRINAMVYAQENTTVYGNKRVKTLYSNKINVMSVTSDFSHVFIMNDLLQKGEIISMPCDRNFGSSKVARCNFFNSKAEFPQGAFALAATLNVPIIAMCVMKKSAFKYHIYIKDLSINNDDNMKKSEKIACLAQKFATNLETIVKKYPEQWFNFYDFWNVEDTIVK
jgi:predicted LPLAT superfamily acyltransferase